MYKFCYIIEHIYDQIWKDICASGECPISVIPLNVNMVSLIKTLTSVGLTQARPNKKM